MRSDADVPYVCPGTLTPLALEVTREVEGEVLEGALSSSNGLRYVIRDGVPDLTYPMQLPESDAAARVMYDETSTVYDEYVPLTFKTFMEDEAAVRADLVDALNLFPSARVLETGCGTGRDSHHIARRLSPLGRLFVQDLSPLSLHKCRANLRNVDVPVEFAVANGYYLPFPDQYFDAAFHFGGLNTFGDIKRAFAEMTRVTKPGGKVVMGDESMPPWLRETRFGRVLMNSNPHYRYGLPLEYLPVEARQVRLRWILGGVFYVIDYIVGQGEPEADLEFEIPGARGGSHLTRLYGHLEGVTAETKRLAMAARAKSGKSMHAWLDAAVRAAAEAELKNQ
jgi:ubiquinone/menaquinone biosynthesis C-methylase UbiE